MQKLIVLMSLPVLLFLAGCDEATRFKPKLPVGGNVENIPSFVMENFKLTSTEKGAVKWIFNAKATQIFEMKKKAYAQNVEIKYFEDSKKYSLLTADKAVLDTDTNFMEMTGNVHLQNSSGATLQTEKLFWDDAHKKMYSDEEVTIIKEGSTLNGVGFESDVQMKNVVIKNKVKLKARNLKSGKIF